MKCGKMVKSNELNEMWQHGKEKCVKLDVVTW